MTAGAGVTEATGIGTGGDPDELRSATATPKPASVSASAAAAIIRRRAIERTVMVCARLRIASIGGAGARTSRLSHTALPTSNTCVRPQ